MRKSAFALSVLSAVFFSASIVHAEDFEQPAEIPQPQFQREHREEGGPMNEGGQGERRGKGMKEGRHKMGMGGGMMFQQVVATSDGGVVILNGHKMTKYDASLNLVNEVELKKEKGPKPPKAEAKAEVAAEVPAPVEPESEPMPAAEPLVPAE